MVWIFLLLFTHIVKCLSGTEQETLCISKACFTLHMDRVSFAKAHKSCEHKGGYLMTIRNRQEENVLRSLLSEIQGQQQDTALQFWIGLKLNRGSCVEADKTLRGFKWVSREEESHYSNWGEEPVSTCMERCVRFSYTLLGPNQMKWRAGPCKSPAFYACKFYFKGMCKPLALLGPGEITYTAVFSEKPQRSKMTSFPLGTYAVIQCPGQQQHYSVCTGSDDTYNWTDTGPFCKPGERNCAVGNGGCADECHQDADDVRCVCREPYELDDDGISCKVKASCGVDTCEHQCTTGETGYLCKCAHGFILDENQRNCSDVDECTSQVCGDHTCVNTHGSYMCVCQDGYELVHGKCTDVDECARSRCQHSCLNNIGSFSCYCNEGFTLSQDGHTCVDIDECVSNSCEFACVNSVGSFSCACPRGFHLESDGSICTPDLTEESNDPADRDTQENSTGSITRTTVEFPHTDPPLPDLVNVTHGNGGSNATIGFAKSVNTKIIICVLGSVIPLLVLVAVTLAIAIFRCSRTKKEAKKMTTADGYCWVSSGLDPRLEKLYESILTDDL